MNVFFKENEAQESCEECPAGQYCLGGSADLKTTELLIDVDNISRGTCPVGYYCPAGTESPYQFPCKKGTYNPITNSETIEACLECTAGQYCSQEGLSAVTGACSPGYYCPLGSSESTAKKCGTVMVLKIHEFL